jgi:hypothetical protein
MLKKKKVSEPEKNPLIKIIRKIIPVKMNIMAEIFMNKMENYLQLLCF